MAYETTIAENWIRTTLNNDVTLTGLLGGGKIYNEVAPQNTAAPYVVFRYRGSRDMRGMGASRRATTIVYLVEVISLPSQNFTDLGPIADRVDTVLHDTSGTNAGGRVLGVVRENPFKLTEPQSDGTYIRRLGGEYRIDVSKTAL